MILESESLSIIIELHTHCHILNGIVFVAPCIEHGRIDDEGEDEVDHNAASHDEESLICLLATELPRLCRSSELLGCLCLVNHTVDLTVTANRQPSDTILRTYLVVVFLITYVLRYNPIVLFRKGIVVVL